MTPQQANELLRNALLRARDWTGHEDNIAVIDQALAATADCAPAPTEPAVDRDAILEEAAALFDQPHMEYFGCNIQEDIRALKLATPASPAVPARDHLLKIIAFAYQIAGWHDAPEHILAVLAHPESATAAQVDAMLPYQVGGVRAVPEPAPLAPSYGPVHVVADLVRNLLTLDQALSIYSAFHVDYEGKRRCRTRAVSISKERVVDGKWVESSRKDVPYSIVVWAKPAEDLAPQVAQPSGNTGELPQVAQASQPTSAEELQQKEHIPPFAEPASQLFADPKVMAELGRWAGDDPGYGAVLVRLAITEIEKLEAELASRCRAQGSITNDSKGLPTSAEGKDSERLALKIIDSKACQTCDGKGSYYGEECHTCCGYGRVSTGKDTDKEAK